jgi:hypothetical protein
MFNFSNGNIDYGVDHKIPGSRPYNWKWSILSFIIVVGVYLITIKQIEPIKSQNLEYEYIPDFTR